MRPWLEVLQDSLRAVPQDVDNATLRRHINAVLKERQPAKPVCKHTELIDLWCKAFLDWFKCEYVFLAKDAAAVKQLVAKFDVDHIMRIALAAWAHKDTYPCNMALTLPKLLSHINEIREWLNANHTGKAKAMPAFKQLEILRDTLAKHPCNPRSIAYNPDSASMKDEDDYDNIKRRIKALEQEQRKQALG